MSRNKKDPSFKRNLNLLCQSLYGLNSVVTTNDIENPDFSDSFAFCPLSIETEEENFDPISIKAPPIKAA